MKTPTPSIRSSELRLLWELLPHPEGTITRWYAKNGDQKRGGRAESLEELVRAAYHNAGFNFYVAPNPAFITGGNRHSAEDVSHWSFFVIDIDPLRNAQYPRPLDMADEIVKYVTDMFQLHGDPIRIFSGRGVQLWWRLGDWVLDDTIPPGQISSPWSVSRWTARAAMGYWIAQIEKKIGEQYECKIDTSCRDLPRVMRCPGTTNTKTGLEAEFVDPSGERFLNLPIKLVRGTPAENFVVKEPEPLAYGTHWQDVLVHLTIKAQNYLTRGKSEPGRHDTMWHTARCLAEHGLTRQEVERALVHANRLQGPDEELTGADIQHALDTAFSRLTAAPNGGTIDARSTDESP